MNDYIERDKIGLTDFEIIMCNGDYKKGLKMLLNKIESIPAADVRPVVRGKWTLNKDGSGTCSECGFVQNSCWDLDNWDNFCHHCGADMRGERCTQIMCNKCGGKRFIAQGDIMICNKYGAKMEG